MVPLKIFKNGSVHELNKKDFSNGIIELCEKHREESRALAFAFLIYDFRNPQIIKVLEDADYWNALDTISGKFLSIYYIHSRERNFAEDLSAANDLERRGLHPINGGMPFSNLLPILKKYLALDNNVKLPSILFFQVEGKLISDYFLIELSEEGIEKIKADGVEQANRMADEILVKAKKESERILQDSRKEAGKIIENGQKEAAVFEEKSKLAIKQAARDTELLVKEKLTSLFDRVFKKEVSKVLTPDFLQKLILQMASKWDNKTQTELILSEEDKSELETLLFLGLKNELKETISIKIGDNVSKGFHIRLEKEHLYYDFSDESIADILKSFLNPRLKEIMDERNG